MDFHSLMGQASNMMLGKRNDDSLSDRLNYRYSVSILIVLAIINMNRLYTDQIKCWVPAFFTPNYDEYVRSVCFVQNTYYVKHDDKTPKTFQVKKENEILYYQWIPFVLLIKAFLFYIPRISWNTLGLKSGIQVSDLVESSFDYKLPTADATHRQMCLDYVVDSIDQYCNDHRRQSEERIHANIFQRILITGWCMSGKYLGNYLVVLYMTTKFMYIVVSVLQIFLLSVMLGSNFALYGIQVLDRFFRGVHWDTESRLFPKTTLCDFTIREFGHPKRSHDYTVPCVLPLNLFNQQMFTFLYFWYAIVILLNICDFILWSYSITPRNRLDFIRRRLHTRKHSSIKEMHDQSKIIEFTHGYLEADGFFILSLIKENSSDYVAAEIVYRLYTEKFLRKYHNKITTAAIYDHINGQNENVSKRRHLCSLIC
ncbi:unnamed protein product [Rotaria socialis]|uniref:Innexin n=2 Tax=Rotaria socialis TaxID=392032 RepID=A0A820U8D8_9BILA|nr:unnamed protein product [Rotaria socialis]CAF3176878.1 unnamed protein product [Rotaria socialis]CAF3220715.1 unnamed protein product [Rotaria socialis]CAF3451021.1 unnamed protein product [Rotaria socialis]CAF3720030.1 unnamed protein product [Rotaria socialis]